MANEEDMKWLRESAGSLNERCGKHPAGDLFIPDFSEAQLITYFLGSSGLEGINLKNGDFRKSLWVCLISGRRTCGRPCSSGLFFGVLTSAQRNFRTPISAEPILTPQSSKAFRQMELVSQAPTSTEPIFGTAGSPARTSPALIWRERISRVPTLAGRC